MLKDFCERYYDLAKNDLANVFLERCLELTTGKGAVQIVMPQNWLFLATYKKQREDRLKNSEWKLIALLGPKAFQTPMWDFNVQLLSLVNDPGRSDGFLFGVDVSELKSVEKKEVALKERELLSVSQGWLVKKPDARVVFSVSDVSALESYANSYQGMTSGDNNRFFVFFWEVPSMGDCWEYLQGACSAVGAGDGHELALRWDSGHGALVETLGVGIKGRPIWGRKGVAVRQIRPYPSSVYLGYPYEMSCAVLVPKKEEYFLPVLCFCESDSFQGAVYEIDQKLNVTNATLLRVPFDIEKWEKVASERYPNGLPKPYSDDPTQWIFHGHPQPASEPLQVAVARLLGYRWPAESDADMELSAEARVWIARSASLNALADDDGIVCLPPVRGEKAAADRLENLLQAAFGTDWTPQRRNQLLEQVDAKSLDAWLRDKFFEQHCKLFQHRPFIWHVWDGLKDGFSALVNYHKLTRANLERLIYTYLGDWIRTQQHGVEQKLDGADIRLSAAQNLKARLEAILAGETPYDIFVRWKPLAEQPIGWEPDLNDGVRLNIRPFMTAEVLRHNKKPKLNIEWKKDRGNDVPSAPWYTLGLQYGEKEGARINDHHLTLAAKKAART